MVLAWTVSVANVRRVQRASLDPKALQEFLEHVGHQDPLDTKASGEKMARWGYLGCLAKR